MPIAKVENRVNGVNVNLNMFEIQKKIFISLLLFLLLFTSFRVLAQTQPATPTATPNGAFNQELTNQILNITKVVSDEPGYITNTSDERFFGDILIKIFVLGFSFLGVFFMLIIIYSGFQWMFSSGNEEKITTARKRITGAVTGLALILCAFIIAYAIFSFLTTEYLQIPPDGLEAPQGYGEVIACTGEDGSTPPECADRGTRIFCVQGNCVECVNDNNCQVEPFNQLGLTHCNETWHVCTLPEDTACSSINNAGLCIARSDCRWQLDSSHQTWELGSCVIATSYSCSSQCPQAQPYCLNNNQPNDAYSCQECHPNIDESCGFLRNCTQPFTEGGEGVSEDDYYLYICTIFGF